MSLIKFNIEMIREEFRDRGFILLSKTYKNTKENLRYICLKHKEHSEQTITYANFRVGKGCKHCGLDRKRLDYSLAPEKFKERGYILLTDWKIIKNNSQNLEYIYAHITNIKGFRI